MRAWRRALYGITMPNKYNIGGDNQDNSGMVWDVLTTILLCVAVALVVCWATGCSTVKYIDREVEKIVYRDSISLRDTTIFAPIPLGKDQAIVSTRDTSRLETSVAKSVAFVNEKGQICHTLENKRGSIEVVAKIPSKTIWIETTSEKEHTVLKTEYVEKPLSWWKKFRLDAFWWLAGAVLLLLIWTFRKFIVKLFAL